MASLPGWDSQTFSNVASLLGKSKTWNDLIGSYASKVPDWTGAFSAAPPVDTNLAYNWAAKGGTLPTDLLAVSSQGYNRSNPYATGWDPSNPAVSAEFWNMANQYQQQAAALSDASALKNYGLSQAYMKQLANTGESAKNADFNRNMQAFMAQQYSPEMTAAIGASQQNQMLQAMQGEGGMLTAVSNAAKNASDAAAQGFRLGMQNYYKA